MASVSFSPSDRLQELQAILDRFRNPTLSFEDVFGSAAAGVFPPVNLFTDKDGVVIKAEVPGLEPERVEVTVERGTLTISGERKRDQSKGTAFHRRERPFGTFSRTIHLADDLDTGNARARCQHGVLTVWVPKQEQAKPRKISINGGAS